MKVSTKSKAAGPTEREYALSVIRAEAQAVERLAEHLDEGFERAVGLVTGCEGTVIVAGVGKSGIIAQKISATLASTGTPSHYLHPTEAMHGDLGRVRGGDVVILLSYSGNTEEVLSLAAVLRQDKVPIIALCSKAETHLGRLADAVLSVGDVTEACPHNLAPTASTTAMLAMGDALALAASRRRNFSADDFAKRHPGGMLGRQLMPITDAMRLRVGENLPLLSDTLSVQGLIDATSMGERRVGAALLVGKGGKLTGILTDADIVKLIAKHHGAALTIPVAQVMTRNPKTLADTALIRDAVQLVREMRLDEIPIVDDSGRPVGMIDVQDLLALKVIEE